MKEIRPPPPPEAVLMEMLFGQCVSKGIAVAADLAVADHLKDGPKSADEVAALVRANPEALYRLLRMLAAVGIFTEQHGRRFGNNALSERLRGDVPGSMRAVARWWGHALRLGVWNELGHSVATGKTGFSKLYPGKNPFDVLAEDEEAQRIFNEAMTGFTMQGGRAITAAYDFRGFGTVVDVGGGHGALAMMIKEQSPKTRVVVYDLPHVIEGAQEMIAAAGRAVETASGSFFERVPRPADAYVMKSVIHDWDDESCIQILTLCRDGLNEGGKILVCEMVVADGPESVPAKILDLEMLVGPGGLERTKEQFAALLGRAGLRLSRIVRTESPMCVVEAVAA